MNKPRDPNEIQRIIDEFKAYEGEPIPLTDEEINVLSLQQILKMREETVCPYEFAEKIQERLKAIYSDLYVPQHTAEEYLKLIFDYGVTINERHVQTSKNYPQYVYEAFCVATQHIYGVTKEHILDQVFDIVNDKQRRVFCGVHVDQEHLFYELGEEKQT